MYSNSDLYKINQLHITTRTTVTIDIENMTSCNLKLTDTLSMYIKICLGGGSAGMIGLSVIHSIQPQMLRCHPSIHSPYTHAGKQWRIHHLQKIIF